MPPNLRSSTNYCTEQKTCSTQSSCSSIPVCEVGEDGSCQIVCGNGYVREGEYCVSCAGNCCERNDDDTCKTCVPGFGPSGTECVECAADEYSDGTKCVEIANCSTARHDIVTAECSMCVGGFGLNADGMCTKCTDSQASDGTVPCKTIPGCIKTNSENCTECDAGYALTDSGTCDACQENEYGDGTACRAISGCVIASHEVKTPLCTQCQLTHGLYENGTCIQCAKNAYGTGTSTCLEIQYCLTTNQTAGKPACQKCEDLSGLLDDGTCERCSEDQITDSVSPCVTLLGCNKTDGVKTCTLCDAGWHMTSSGSCEECAVTEYSNGKTCHSIDGCLKASHDVMEAYCLQCNPGYAFLTGTCRACTGNTWSDGSPECYKGPENCEEAVHTENKCQKCSAGYELTEDAQCTACEALMCSEDGITCKAVTIVKDCIEYHTARDRCLKCGNNLMVSFDNQCRECVNGEFATGSECVQCAAGTFSVFGSINCTSDCGAFTNNPSACLNSGICKMSAGNCVAADDQTILIIGLSTGIGGFLIIATIVVLCVLVRIGWFVKRKAKKAALLAEELELVTFEDSTVEVQITPNTLTFGGQVIDFDEKAHETLTITNNDSCDIVFGVSSEENPDCEITVSETSGIIKKGKSIELTVECLKHISSEVGGSIKVTVASKKSMENGKHIKVSFAMRGLATGEISAKEIVMQDKIGEGVCGIVHRGLYKGINVAIKQLKRVSKYNEALFERELEMLKMVKGSNVVKFFGSVTTVDSKWHVTELMDLGTLTNVIAKTKLSPELKRKVMKDVAVGMATVHSFNVIHRDLKPDNVLCKAPLDLTNEDMCKITDFGTSRAIDNIFAMTMTKGQGTPLYMAPEIISGQKRYSKAVDMYSYGILCACLWNDGRLPYSEYNFPNALELQNAILEGCRPQITPECPFKVLIDQCWDSEPERRPTFGQIIPCL